MAFAAVTVHTIRHGTRPAEELVETLLEAGVETLVDVRRFPGSRRNPQFGQAVLAATLESPIHVAMTTPVPGLPAPPA